MLDHLMKTWRAFGAGKKSDCDLWSADHREGSILFAKPRKFMNENGVPLTALIRTLDIPIDRVLFLHDEMDI